MIVSLSNAMMLCPLQQWGVPAKAAWPVFGCRLNKRSMITCLKENHLSVRFLVGCLKRRDFEGSWEDPDDGSDDSEYEDDYDEEEEEEEMEENDLDYESDWEADGKDKVVVRNADTLAMREYEEALVKGL